MEKTILGDGSIIFHIPIDEKLVMKNVVLCKKDTHAAVQRWCQAFQETMMQCGVYVHPLWLFHKNHGGEWGFKIGDGTNDDVPTATYDLYAIFHPDLPTTVAAHYVPKWGHPA